MDKLCDTFWSDKVGFCNLSGKRGQYAQLLPEVIKIPDSHIVAMEGINLIHFIHC